MNLFYPSHDIALSNGVRHFNPPAAALRLQEDLASLSNIWNQPFLRGETAVPLPWGWDWDTRRYIHEQYHIPYEDLPSDEQLEAIRQLSSRKTMIPLITSMEQKSGLKKVHLPSYLPTEDEVRNYMEQHDKADLPFVLKTPWSSSGRGLSVSHVRTKDGTLLPTPREAMMKHASATIRKMGGIMGEDWIENKQHDFALLFFASTSEVHFIGYSLFDNDDATGGTTYRQGYLLSNEEIERRLGIRKAELHLLIKSCEETLTEMVAPLLKQTWELGYLGIDMITYLDKGQLQVAPMELNLRTTMGTVCRLYYDQHHSEGLFRISPMQRDGHFKAEFLTSQ